MNVTGQTISLRFTAIACYLGGALLVTRFPVLAFVLLGVGTIFSILARRQQALLPRVPLTDQKKKKAFITMVIASTVGCVGTSVFIYWREPNPDVPELILISAVLMPLTIGYFYWRVFKKVT